MAFTYDLSSADPAIVAISRLRLQSGDTVEDNGVLPNGVNVQDEEIAALGVVAGTTLDALPLLLDTIAVKWSLFADMRSGDVQKAASQIAASFAARAATARRSVDRARRAAQGGSTSLATAVTLFGAETLVAE